MLVEIKEEFHQIERRTINHDFVLYNIIVY